MLEAEDVQRDCLVRLRAEVGALHQQAVSAQTTAHWEPDLRQGEPEAASGNRYLVRRRHR